MERSALFTLGMLALAAGGLSAAPGEVVTVVGNDDGATDRQAIQDAIDAVGPGGTVELVGTFQLDGERIEVGVDGLEIRGARVDADGDGGFHEDWPDGRDNDGDGLVDEDDWDAVLRGVTGPGGAPVRDDGVNGLFNRGFTVDGAVPAVFGLTVRDLAFEDFHRAIELIPEWASPTGRCEDRVRVPGSMRQVLFEGNRFSDNVLGITVLGDVAQATIRENVFERHAIFGPVVEGGTPRCPLAGGGSVPIELTPPEEVTIDDNLGADSPIGTAATINTQIRDNVLEGGAFGILVAEDTGMRISRNRITGAGGGILVVGGDRVTVIENSVADSFSGAELYDSGDGVVVASNEFSADIGVWVFLGASGYRIVENSFPASGFVDVWLLSGSTGNTVINGGDPITVLDQGTDNRLIGNITPF